MMNTKKDLELLSTESSATSTVLVDLLLRKWKPVPELPTLQRDQVISLGSVLAGSRKIPQKEQQMIQLLSYQRDDLFIGLHSTLHYPIMEMIAQEQITPQIQGAGIATLNNPELRTIVEQTTGQPLPVVCFVNFLTQTHYYSHLFVHDNKARNRQFHSVAYVRWWPHAGKNTIELFTGGHAVFASLLGSAAAKPFAFLCWQILLARHENVSKRSEGLMYSDQPEYPVRPGNPRKAQ